MTVSLKPIKHNYNIVSSNGNQILFSYETPVAIIKSDGSVYRTSQYFSKTTTTHINKFLTGLDSEKIEQDKIYKYMSKII